MTSGTPNVIPPMNVEAKQPSSANPTVAGNVASANQGGGAGYSAATKVETVNDLKTKAPKLWQAMLLGIATNICNESQHHTDRIKQILRDMRNNA